MVVHRLLLAFLLPLKRGSLDLPYIFGCRARDDAMKYGVVCKQLVSFRRIESVSGDRRGNPRGVPELLHRNHIPALLLLECVQSRFSAKERFLQLGYNGFSASQLLEVRRER